MSEEYETLEFKNPNEFLLWMQQNHNVVDGVWIKVYKKASGIASIAPPEALDVALCYGWIDGLRRGLDETSYLQKYTPRRKRSLWSKRNIEHVERLVAAGLMTEHGVKEIDRAKADGRWDAAYDAQATMVIPDSFMSELKRHPKALAKFETLSKSAKFTIGWQIQTAKMESTKLARSQKIIAELENDE